MPVFFTLLHRSAMALWALIGAGPALARPQFWQGFLGGFVGETRARGALTYRKPAGSQGEN